MFSLIQSVERIDNKSSSEPPRHKLVLKAAVLPMAMAMAVAIVAKYLPSATFLTLNFGQCKKFELNDGNISDI